MGQRSETPFSEDSVPLMNDFDDIPGGEARLSVDAQQVICPNVNCYVILSNSHFFLDYKAENYLGNRITLLYCDILLAAKTTNDSFLRPRGPEENP